MSDDSEEEVLNDKTKPTKKEGSSLTNEIKQAFDKKSPAMVPKEKVEDVVEDANHIRVFTEKDFDSLKFDFTKGSKSTEPCLLKVKLSTYGIGSISMEYNWNKKGTNLQKTYRKVASSRPVYYSKVTGLRPKVTVHKDQISPS